MSSLVMDFRQAARALGKRPGFTSVCVLTLALGIGASTAIFSVVDAVLFKPLPFPDPGRLALLWSTEKGADGKPEEYGLSIPDFRDFRERQRAFRGLAAMESGGSVNVTGTGDPERLSAARVTLDFFGVLGVPLEKGRAFLPEEETASVVVISHGLWQRRFGGDPGVLGRMLTLDGAPHVVTGVAPSGFRFMEGAELWLPLVVSNPEARRGQRALYAVGRLASGVSRERADSEMGAVAARLATEFPDTNSGWGVTLIPMRDLLVRPVRKTVLVLLAAVGFVLLIACANVSNLLIVRAVERQGEIAVRTALGATRAHLVRQTLAESVLLGLAGGALGTGLAFAGLKPLLAAAPADLSNLPGVGLDFAALAFTLAVSLATGLLFGIAPALLGSPELAAVMSRESRASSGTTKGRKIQNALVVVEIALAFLLLFGAGLMTKGFRALVDVNPGFRPDAVATLELTLPDVHFASFDEKARALERILESVSAAPGVVSASASTKLPLKELSGTTGFFVEGRVPAKTNETETAHFRRVTPGWFRTIGTPLLEGRDFEASDRAESLPVAVVSRAFAQKYWPGGSALGKRIQRATGKPRRWLEIVGIAADVHDTDLSREPEPALYVPYAQGAGPATVFLAVRAAEGTRPALSEIARAVRAVDAGLPVANYAPMERLVAASLARQRFAVLLLGFLGTAGLVVASVGIYGVVAYGVSRRSREIGIRMALGATARSVAAMVVRQSARFAVLGVVIGAAASIAFARAVASLVRVRPSDPAVLVATALALFGVALVASYVPARRAAALDPARCLKGD